MSLSSVAQDSALRLTPDSVLPPTVAEVARAAAAGAAAAVASGSATGTAVSETEATNAGIRAASTAQGSAPVVASGPLGTLVKYIPTETITMYVAIQGALGEVKTPATGRISDADFTSRWVWLAIMLGATVFLITALSYRAQKGANPQASVKWPYFDIAATGAAFLIWALSLPGTPLRDFAGYDYNAWNSVLLLLGTVAISTLAFAFGKTVTWDKVLSTPAMTTAPTLSR